MIREFEAVGLRWVEGVWAWLGSLGGWQEIEMQSSSLVLLALTAVVLGGCRAASRTVDNGPSVVLSPDGVVGQGDRDKQVAFKSGTGSKRAPLGTGLALFLVGSMSLTGCSGGGGEGPDTNTNPNTNLDSGGGTGDPLGFAAEALVASGPVGGPFTEYSGMVLTNNTDADISWTASFDQNWATLSSTAGTLGAGEEFVLDLLLNEQLVTGFGELATSGALVVEDLTSTSGETTITRSVGFVVSDTAGQLEISAGVWVSAVGPVGGPYTILDGDLLLENLDGRWLDWRASSSAGWVALTETSGRLQPGVEFELSMTFGVDKLGGPVILPPGDYNTQISVVNLSGSGGEVSVPVHLRVGAGSLPLGEMYFVDFDDGSDAADGKSPVTPWKHSPGDANALGVPAGTLLAPGDEVIFKGGVHYRGSIRSQSSGIDGKPIIFDGNTRCNWGPGKAVIDGSEDMLNWVQVSGNLYSANIPAGVDAMNANLFEGRRRLVVAQGPTTPSDPLRIDNTAEYSAVSVDNVTTTTLTDPGVFGALPPNFWEGAYICIWALPNLIYTKRLTGFDASTGTVSFDTLSNIYTDRDTLYTIVNSESMLDAPGEYVVDETAGTVFLWPYEPEALGTGTVTVSVRQEGINLIGNDFQTIRGFRIIKHSAGLLEWNSGVGIINSYMPIEGILIENNEIALGRSMERYGALTLFTASNSTARGNFIHNNLYSKGAFFDGCTNLLVENNTLYSNGNTGIRVYSSEDSKVLNNKVFNHRGVHANGITLYLGCRNILVRENVVLGGNIAATFENATDILVEYNIFSLSPEEDTYTVADWGGSQGAKYFNNVIASVAQRGLYVSPSSQSGVQVKNNIIDGTYLDTTAVELSNNIYTSFSWQQSESTLGLFEIYEPDKNLVFANPEMERYELVSGSPAIDSGVDLGLEGPVYGAGVDIGAVEYRDQ